MLINCVAYQDGKRLAEIQPEEIHRYLAMPNCFVWVALLDRDDGSLEQMQAEFDLHPLAVEDAQHGHQRPKIEEYGDSLFAVMHLLEPENGDLRVGEVNVFAGPNYVLTIRSHAEQGFGAVRERCEREPELLKNGSGYVLYALIDAVVDRYFPLLDAVETELEGIEERIFAGSSPRENVEALYAPQAEARLLRHAVAPLLDAVNNLYGARVPAVCAGMKEYFRDVSDHLQRLNQTIETHPRHHRHCDRRQSLDDQPAGKRDDEAPGSLRRARRRADDDRRHLRHELRAHAGARVEAMATRSRPA